MRRLSMLYSRQMKALLTVLLLFISAASTAAQQSHSRASLDRSSIKETERLLSGMGYWTGAVDGKLDSATQSALIAFQKWESRPVTGQLTIEELEAIRTSVSPRARETGYAHAEVDLDRQVFLWVDDEGKVKVLPVSTGTGKEYVDEGQTSVAYTPRGRFLVYRKGAGWEKGPLGSVYYPNDISGGIAIHGSRNVPSEPASHGCIRVPMLAAVEVSRLLKLGTIVLVYDQVSFVSAKDWVKNPKLKEAALRTNAAEDEGYTAGPSGTKGKSPGTRKLPAKVIRA